MTSRSMYVYCTYIMTRSFVAGSNFAVSHFDELLRTSVTLSYLDDSPQSFTAGVDFLLIKNISTPSKKKNRNLF
jgi:hypothetical protein